MEQNLDSKESGNWFKWVKPFFTCTVKSSILTLWIALLIVVVYFAAIGRISNLLLISSESNNNVTFFYNYSSANTPTDFLDSYFIDRGYQYNKPPIRYVLNALMNHPYPPWDERFPQFKGDITKSDKKEKTIQSYKKLFRNIEEKIELLVYSDLHEVKKTKIKFKDVVPKEFSVDWNNEQKIEINLPSSVINWVERQKERIEDRKRRASLIDVFAILMALGAFGSLTFLIRDLINSNNSSIVTFIFKPVLGVFLAVAVFILDMATHSVISESGILSIKHETLYFLAFAAGFLSDKAYEHIENKAATSLNNVKENNNKK